MLPSISIVTPSLNQGKYLERTLQSVLKQDYAAKEYIVVDGGSRDASVEILQRYRARLDRLVIEPDRGQAHAIQKGFAFASGEILCWLNSDDVLLPGALKSVAEYFFRHREIEAVNCGAYTIDASDRLLRLGHCSYTLGVKASFDRLRIYGQEGIFQCATFWRASAYHSVGGVDPSLHYAMDLDLFIRLANRRPIERLPRIVACFRRHAEAKTSTQQSVQARELRIIGERYSPEMNPMAQRLRKRAYLQLGRVRRAGLWAMDRLGMVDFISNPCEGTPA